MKKERIKIVSVILLLCIGAIWLAQCDDGIEYSDQKSIDVAKMTENLSDEPEQLYARSAVLMDADSGRVLVGKDEKTPRPMASTTKIMTCILALEDMFPDQVVVASKEAASQPKVHLKVTEGQQFYLLDLLYSLMLESHNDSAVMVAEGIAGSVDKFTDLMNTKAKELGLINTHFVTPNGLDARDEGGIHATTAEELAKIMKYCIYDSPKKEQFLEITGAKEYQFEDVERKNSYTCYNHNTFLTMMDGALSGKTGFTADAGYCYVGALRQDERTFIVALLACGWPNHKGYKWSDTKRLMEYGIENYTYQNVWKKFPVQEMKVKESGDTKNIYKKNSVVEIGIDRAPEKLNILLKQGEKVDTVIRMKASVTAPVRKGEKVGNISYMIGKSQIAKYEIVTKKEVQKRTFQWCLKRMERRFLFTNLD